MVYVTSTFVQVGTMISNYQQTIKKNHLKCAWFVQRPTHLLVTALSGYAFSAYTSILFVFHVVKME